MFSCFLDDSDIESIGLGLLEFGAVTVSRLAARNLHDGSSYLRGWPSSDAHERPSFFEALREVDGVASVRTVTVHVEDRLTLHLRRRAGATYYSGDISLFEGVIDRIASALSQKRRLFSNRARTVDAPPPRPIALRLTAGSLEAPSSISDLLDAMHHQREASVAVLHRNPYLHVVVTDYADGSNFDVLVTADDEVIVYPGFRASVSGLTRLTGVIADRFAATETVEVDPSPRPTLEELFAG